MLTGCVLEELEEAQVVLEIILEATEVLHLQEVVPQTEVLLQEKEARFFLKFKPLI